MSEGLLGKWKLKVTQRKIFYDKYMTTLLSHSLDPVLRAAAAADKLHTWVTLHECFLYRPTYECCL